MTRKAHIYFSAAVIRMMFIIIVLGGFLSKVDADIFTEARDRLASGDAEKAVALLQSHLNEEPPSAGLYFELGQAQWEAKNGVGAALAFRRALMLDPSLAVAREALNVANRALGLPPVETTWRDQIASTIPLNNLTLLGAVIFWLGAFILLFQLLGMRSMRLIILGGVLGVLGLASVILVFTSEPRITHDDEAIIINKAGTSLSQTPTNDPSAKITTIPQGRTIRIIDSSGRWFHGELPGGQKGWLLQEGVERIRLKLKSVPISLRKAG